MLPIGAKRPTFAFGARLSLVDSSISNKPAEPLANATIANPSRRKEQRTEDADDRDTHQEFDKRKPKSGVTAFHARARAEPNQRITTKSAGPERNATAEGSGTGVTRAEGLLR